MIICWLSNTIPLTTVYMYVCIGMYLLFLIPGLDGNTIDAVLIPGAAIRQVVNQFAPTAPIYNSNTAKGTDYTPLNCSIVTFLT